MNLKYLFIIFAIILSSIKTVYSQCTHPVMIQDSSFEGPPGLDSTPPLWTSCHPGYGPDTQPGAGLNSGAYQGNTYLGLGYSSSQGAQGVTQQLLTPLIAGTQYSFTIELSSYEYVNGVKFDPNCASCEIWGGFSSCDMNTLLWTSGYIQEYSTWTQYTATFTATQNFSYISIVIHGCSSTAYIGVDDISSFKSNFSSSAQVENTNLCAGDSTGKASVQIITGNNPPYTYLWSSNPPQTDSVLNNVPAGSYTVTVSNNGSVCSTATVYISQLPALYANISPDLSTCFTIGNGDATAGGIGGVPPYSFTWSNGDTAATTSHLYSGNYQVTLTDSHNCTATASVTIDSVLPMSITGDIQPAACPNYNNGSIKVSVSEGVPYYAYAWNTSPAQNTLTAFNLSPGSYTVTVTDAHQCTASNTFTVSATAPSVNLSVTNALPCNNHIINGGIISNAAGGTLPYTYKWNTTPPQTTANGINLPPGFYTLTVTDGAGCTAVASDSVIATGALSLNVTSSGSSCGGASGSANANVSGGASPYRYRWNNGDTIATISNLASGTYLVTVTGVNGCSVSASTTLSATGSSNPANISSDKTVMCSGDSAYICVSGSYTSYHWNNNATTPCIYTEYAGNYYLTVTDNNNCTAESNHLAIQVYPLPPVLISEYGDTLKSYSAVTYQWYFNDNEIPGATSDTYIAAQPGSYTVSVTDTNGCYATSTPTIIGLSGIEQLGNNEEVNAYPNPSVNGWQLTVNGNLVGGIVEIFDDNGRLIYQSEIRNPQSEIELKVARGVYWMRIISGQKSINFKLVRL